MSKTIKILIATLSIILVSIIGVSIFYQARRNYKFIDVDSYTRQMYINYLNQQVIGKLSASYETSKEDARKMLEDELNFKNYIYKEGEVKAIKDSAYSVALLRYIKIDMKKCARLEDYYIALCHEMCHIKFFTGNEIYTQFMTFKVLYESNNEELKQVGTWFGIYVLNRCYTQSYDCSQLIIDYLKSEVDFT